MCERLDVAGGSSVSTMRDLLKASFADVDCDDHPFSL